MIRGSSRRTAPFLDDAPVIGRLLCDAGISISRRPASVIARSQPQSNRLTVVAVLRLAYQPHTGINRAEMMHELGIHAAGLRG